MNKLVLLCVCDVCKWLFSLLLFSLSFQSGLKTLYFIQTIQSLDLSDWGTSDVCSNWTEYLFASFFWKQHNNNGGQNCSISNASTGQTNMWTDKFFCNKIKEEKKSKICLLLFSRTSLQKCYDSFTPHTIWIIILWSKNTLIYFFYEYTWKLMTTVDKKHLKFDKKNIFILKERESFF